MNENQRKIIKIAGVLILASFLFPPFISMHPYGGAENVGYGFILIPPTRAHSWGDPIVNTGMLLIEWIGIALLAAVCWLMRAEKKSGE